MTDVLFDIGEPKPPPPVAEPPPDPPKPMISDPTTPMIFEPPLSGATLSECKKFRYSLWRRFLSAGKTRFYIAWNPSVADEIVDDRTVDQMEFFCKRDGIAMMLLANIIPYRETDSKKMRKDLKALGDDGLKPHWEANRKAIIEMATQADEIVICCGADCERFGAFDRAWAALREAYLIKAVPVQCFGVTKHGHPRHPLYLRHTTEFIPFKPKAIVQKWEPF